MEFGFNWTRPMFNYGCQYDTPVNTVQWRCGMRN